MPDVEDDLVVRYGPIKIDQHARRAIVYHGCCDRFPRKRANGFYRVPACEDSDFDAIKVCILKKHDTPIAGDDGQFGHNRGLKIRGIFLRPADGRTGPPHASNHPESPPTTTAHGLIFQPFTLSYIRIGAHETI